MNEIGSHTKQKLGIMNVNAYKLYRYIVVIGCFLVFGLTSEGQVCENCGVGQPTPGSKLEIKGCGVDSSTSSLNVTDSDETSILYVQDNGRVGINNENPRTTLQIQSSETGGINLNNTIGDPVIGLYVNDINTSRFKMGVDSSDAKKFKIGTTALETNTRFTIDSIGKVGIGTTTPGTKLDVAGNINLNNAAYSSAGSLNRGYYVFKNGTTAYGFKLQYTGTEYGTMMFGPNQADRFLSFGKVGAALEDDDMVEYMRIDLDNGKVGIGTTSPTQVLDVRGGAVFNEDGGSYDFRVEGNTDTALLFLDASADQVGIGTGDPHAKLDVRGSAVFNEDGGDNDFRVEGNGLDDLFMVDASTNSVGIGTSSPTSDLTIVASGTSSNVHLSSYRNSSQTHNWFGMSGSRGTEASPTSVNNGDELGRWSIRGYDGTNFKPAAEIKMNVDAVPGTSDMPGSITFSTTLDGTAAVVARMIIKNSGHTLPGANNAYDLGESGTSWQDLFVQNCPTVCSDLRLKSNIRSSQYGLTEILQLNPVMYQFKPEQLTDTLGNPVGPPIIIPQTDKIGFIAQELQTVISEIVSVGEDANQTLGVRYSELIPVLTRAIQELSVKNDDLEQEIIAIKSRLTTLESK